MEALEVCRSDVLAQKQLTSRVVQHFLERGESWMVGMGTRREGEWPAGQLLLLAGCWEEDSTGYS